MTLSARTSGRGEPMTHAEPDETFRPYLPGVVIDWLRASDTTRHRTVDGTLGFVDISGFTRLTERLARAGKVGAEEMSQILDTIFTDLLDVAYGYGGELIKWCGDAVLLLFEGDEHPARASAAAWQMRNTLRTAGRVTGTSASARLRLSGGVHTGQVTFFLVGTRHRELVVTGPAATETAVMQTAAEAGQIAISRSTAALLDPGVVGAIMGPGCLLGAAPRAAPRPGRPSRDVTGLDLAGCLPVAIAENLLSSRRESEHRRVAVAFVEFSGTDRLLATAGPDSLADALQHVIGVAQDAAYARGVTFLETDICPGGGRIMLVSGAPRSAGHDEDRLLATVRTILDQHRVLTLRAGANAGRVFAGDFGPAYRRTYSVKGDAINLAARLMAKAAPGQLLATAALLDRSTRRYGTSPLPPFRVKGKAAPVHAFDVGALRSGRRSAGDTTGHLVGREAEIAALSEALGSLRRGHGRVVELAGEPGIGKSRLLGELLTMADAERTVVVRCDTYDTAIPYATAGSLLRELLGEADDAPPDTVAATLTAAVASRAPQLAGWLPLLATVIGAELPSTTEVSQLDDAFRRPRLEQAAIELLRTLLDGPAVLAVEDVQFADEASASLLSRLLREVPERPWLIVLTGPPQSPLRAPDDTGALRLTLEPLAAAAAETLLLDATEQAPIPPYQLAAIGRRGAGNPLFLRELAAVVQHGGDIAALPESAEGVIAVEIDQLGAEDRSTLRAAAVMGTSFEAGLLAAVLDHPVDSGVWRRLRPFVMPGPAGGYRFRHALVRDAAYEGLPYVRRRQLHGLLAEAVEQRAGNAAHGEAAQLALHYFHAQRYEAAGYYAHIAGEQAAAAYANPQAAEFFTWALVSARHKSHPAREEVAKLAEALGDVRYRLGEFSAAEDAFAAARSSAHGDPIADARLCEKMALAVARTDGFSAALRWTARGSKVLSAVADPDADRQRALLLAVRALLRYQQGRYAEAAAISSEVIGIADRCGARDVLARALFLRDAADVARGQYHGERWAERALVIWEELGNVSWQAKALNQLGMRAYFEGRWDDALSYYRQACAGFERVGDQWYAAITASNIGEILSNQGRYAEAEDATRPAERVLRASGALSETAFATSVLGRTAARAGQTAEACRLLEAARAGYLRAGERNEVAATEIGIAEALVRAGRAAEALAGTDDMAANALARTGEPNASALGRVRGHAFAQLGLIPQAQEALAASLDAARQRGDAYDEALAVDALIRLAAVTGQQPEPGQVARRDELFGKLGVLAAAAPALAHEA